MSFQNKRDLWYISGNKATGSVFASPTTELEDGAEILNDEIARLKDSDLDGARRWIAVASSPDEAVQKVVNFVKGI